MNEGCGHSLDITHADQRRSFFAKLASVVIGTILGVVPLGTGLASFFDPLRRRLGKNGFRRVASLSALPIGVPRRYSVIGDRTDAWSRYPHEPIGAVYLRRLPDEAGQPRVQAFQVICPHAGCSVDFYMDGRTFRCPCHGSKWKIDGNLIPFEKGKPSPSPRDLDTLEVRIEGDDVLVRYQKFRASTKEKIAIS